MPDLLKIRSWLEDATSRHSSPFAKCILFGSILTSSESADVDVVLVSNDWNIKGHLREMRLSFIAEFGLPLHIQTFHSSQIEKIDEFLNRAKIVEHVL